MSAVAQREETFATAISRTATAIEIIRAGLADDADAEARAKARGLLDNLGTGVIGLVTSALNASTALATLADELDGK